MDSLNEIGTVTVVATQFSLFDMGLVNVPLQAAAHFSRQGLGLSPALSLVIWGEQQQLQSSHANEGALKSTTVNVVTLVAGAARQRWVCFCLISMLV